MPYLFLPLLLNGTNTQNCQLLYLSGWNKWSFLNYWFNLTYEMIIQHVLIYVLNIAFCTRTKCGLLRLIRTPQNTKILSELSNMML